MRRMLNVMRLQAEMAGGARAASRVGIVTSYDPANYCVKVKIKPEGTETGWLPVVSPWVGNGWGMFAPPTPGDMVDIQFQEDNFEAGVACLRFFNDEDRPLAVESGEFWLVHKSGAFFKLQNDGSGTFSDGHGATVKLNGDGSITSAATLWKHTGAVEIHGTALITNSITGQGGMAISGTLPTGGTATIDGTITNNGKNIGSTHVHSGVATGPSNTGVPI